ncbi:MAG: alpha/beta hydrolase [Methanobrevibacter sp.]|uniref:alpha/beta fold hydrolase n=1 Tax=Methanobrevibacter sp. TaxID=66852 RepID=UPI0025F38A07|nr:alpha/beta hydrolase [Methanobrevibacter sp.]MBQ8018153.1 alpha/beta hydrolase [Methanobrevibacter sp.]
MSYLTVSDGTKIYYKDYGEGEAILFSHGLNGSHLNFKRIIKEFEDDYRIICYDQRGHGYSDRSAMHMNVKALGQDLNELIDFLDLTDINLFGHSMGGASIYSHVNQFGCGKLKRIIVSDMSPYMRNNDWKGGIGQGLWSDDDFMDDFDRIFDDVGNANWHITKNLMNPSLADVSNENEMIEMYRKGSDAFTMASLWFSLFKSDQRPAIDNITVPFLYIKPDFALYSMDAIIYIKEHVKSDFILEDNFPDTIHAILNEKPHEVAECVKKFLKEY